MFNNNLKKQRLTSLLIPAWIRHIKDLEVEYETIKELKENMGRFLLIISRKIKNYFEENENTIYQNL